MSTLLKQFEPQLSPPDQSLYLAAIGLLRAGHAADVPFLKRIGWVNDTIDTLERAKQLSAGNVFPVRWISGVVYAQLPGLFGKREAAQADLRWCIDHAAEALRSYAPDLPPLTTVLITHAHWDHVGGHRFFRGLTPCPKFYARANYREELVRSLAAPGSFGERFFGTRFTLDDVRDFRPDATVERETRITIGGTRIELTRPSTTTVRGSLGAMHACYTLDIRPRAIGGGLRASSRNR